MWVVCLRSRWRQLIGPQCVTTTPWLLNVAAHLSSTCSVKNCLLATHSRGLSPTRWCWEMHGCFRTFWPARIIVFPTPSISTSSRKSSRLCVAYSPAGCLRCRGISLSLQFATDWPWYNYTTRFLRRSVLFSPTVLLPFLCSTNRLLCLYTVSQKKNPFYVKFLW